MSSPYSLDRRRLLLAMTAAGAATVLSAASRSIQGTAAIDTHAHVFRRDLPLAERRRYAVNYDATPEAYRTVLAGNGMSRGVLIQPSFLGFDNSYLLAALKRFPTQLRGIVALDRATEVSEMANLASAGVAGIRLNLIGRGDPDLASAAWKQHLGIVVKLGWQVEVQCEAVRLPRLLPALISSGAPIVIDHFGRPDSTVGLADPGFRYLLDAARSDRVYVKLSGAYRIGQALADGAAPRLLDAFGPRRLLWGSDWPHTQFETVADTRATLTALERWVPDISQRHQILENTPAALFGFALIPANTLKRKASR